MKDLQAISDLLDQKWDPSVYEGPRDERFPPGEYISYAGWIFQSLRKGGGKPMSSSSCGKRGSTWAWASPKPWTTSSQMRLSRPLTQHER